DHGQPVAEFDFGGFDHGEITDGEVGEHGGDCMRAEDGQASSCAGPKIKMDDPPRPRLALRAASPIFAPASCLSRANPVTKKPRRPRNGERMVARSSLEPGPRAAAIACIPRPPPVLIGQASFPKPMTDRFPPAID